jgi:thiamine biosynthesis lipoprotein
MGTQYHLKYWSDQAVPVPDEVQADLQSDINALLHEINRQMSTYLPNSELSRFNTSPAGAWFAVSSETAYVVDRAQQLSRLTEGALDVTVGPLVNLWNFGPNTPSAPPTDAELAATQTYCGSELLEVRLEPPALRKATQQLQVDLSSLAKGYAVDRVAQLLETRGLMNYLVEIGGEVVTRGTRTDGQRWRLGIEAPRSDARTVHQIVALRDQALATSGDTRNFRIVGDNGEKISHLIDPHTGRPLPYRGWSVSVLAPSCLEADALATALLVLGENRGYDWSVEHEIAALFLLSSADQIVAKPTPQFQAASFHPPLERQTMWHTYLFAGLLFAVALTGMAIGVILSNRRLKGSCGGLANMKDAQGHTICEGCTNPAPDCAGEPLGENSAERLQQQ